MRDVIWTIITIWVVYRIYEAIKSSKVYIFQKHDHHYQSTSQKEGDIKIDANTSQSQERKPNSDKGGEYVDFEEVKD